MKFSEKLQLLRKENKLSQENLADMLDVSRQSVSKWESGQTYPEMDKLLAMCKIFKCSLDDLTNDEIKNLGENNKAKNNISNIIDELLTLINKTFTMFKNMNFKDIIKLIFEMGLLVIILVLLHLPVQYLYNLCNNIFINFGTTIGNILSSILNLTLNVCYLIIFVIVFVYIYKVRFLDKYETVEVSSKDFREEKINIIEEEIHNVKPEIKTTKKEYSYAFFNSLGSIFIGFVKFFTVCISIPFIFFLLFLFASLILCIILSFKGVFYLSVLLAIIAAITLDIIFLSIIFYFLFNKKINVKRIFIISISSLALLGVSIGLGIYDVTSIKYIDAVPENEKTKTITNKFNMNDEMLIYFHTYYSSIEYVEDNELTEQVIVEAELYKNYSNIAIKGRDNEIIISNEGVTKIEPIRIVNMLIEDLSNKEFHNYNKLSDINLKIYTSKENIQKIKDNMYNNSKREYCDELRKENYHYQNEIDNLQNKINDLEEKNTILNEEIEDYKMTIQEYKDNIKGLLEN